MAHRPVHVVTEPGTRPRPNIFGGAGSAIWGGTIDDWDENSRVRGNKWYGEPGVIGEAHKMMTDAHVQMAVNALVRPIQGATWDFKPGGKEAIDIEVADFCRYNFFELHSWHALLGSIQRGYVRDGFTLVEVTDNVAPVPDNRFPLHPGSGFGVVNTGFYSRSGWTVFGWQQNKKDPTKISSITQYIQGSDQETSGLRRINATRLLRFTWEQDGADYEGSPILRAAYGPWWSKRLLMRIELMSHERNHLSQPVVTMPEDSDRNVASDEIDKLATVLSNWRAHESGFVILPGGYQLDFKSGLANTNIGATIERCNFDIAHLVGSGFMLLGTKATSGSYALASTQQGMYEMGLEAHARFIENSFNIGQDGWSPVERLVRLNYGSDVALPRLTARNMPTRDWSKILPIIHNLTQSGNITPSLTTEEYIRDVTFMPPLGITEEEYEESNTPPPMLQVPPEEAFPQEEPETDEEDDDS